MCSRSRKWGNSGPRRWTFPLVHHWMFYSIEWWAYSLTGAISTGGGSRSPQSEGLCWGNEAARPWGRPHAGAELRARALSLQSDDLQSGTSTMEHGANRISQSSREMTGGLVRLKLWCMGGEKKKTLFSDRKSICILTPVYITFFNQLYLFCNVKLLGLLLRINSY